MIVQCPSCQSRFSIDSSKISSSSSRGRCSVCGQVFILLDYAVEGIEAAALRDRFEEEGAKKARGILGGFSGVYGTGEARAEEEVAQEYKAEAEVQAVAETTEETVEREEIEAEPEEEIQEESPHIPPLEEAKMEEKAEFGEEEAGITGEAEKGDSEAEEVEREIEEFAEEEEKGKEPIISKKEEEWQGEEATGLPQPEVESYTGEEAKSGDESGVLLSDTFKPLGRPERRLPFFPVLVVVLIILAIVGVSWYLYQSGVLTSADSITGKFIRKISSIRSKSAITLYNLKNEQEPALDGNFFVVRGVIQNNQKVLVPYVPLRIKVFDSKNRVILTGQTIAGKVLKAEEISRMTVQNVNKRNKSLMEQNKKSTGRLAPGSKLPFAFLFDLSKFPRKTAKTFQVEMLKPPSNK